VYEVLFAADPELLEAKKQEWRESQVGSSLGGFQK
jgi:hypothetical protein